MNNWQPILNGEKLKKAKNIIHEISNILNNGNKYNDYSLINGDAGISLFYSYLFINSPNKHYKKIIYTFVEKLITALNERKMYASFMNGICGVSWVLQHLANIDFYYLNKNENDFISTIDKLINNAIKIEASKKNIDLFNGLVGFAVYFLERLPSKKQKRELKNIVLYLELIAKKDEKGIRWLNYNTMRYNNPQITEPNILIPEILMEENCNLGLAHGVPGAIFILSKIYTKGIIKEKIKYILERVIFWLLNQKLEENNINTYPHKSLKMAGVKTNLGWCYSDLSIAIALYYAGKNLNNNKWCKDAVELAKKTTLIDFEKSLVTEPFFCHGAAGIIHLYNRFFQHTKLKEFYDAANYWIDILFSMHDKKFEMADFFTEEKNNEKLNNTFYGILFGLPGIGLVLSSAISENEPEWDRCFLLS